jgi:hypothetical protein
MLNNSFFIAGSGKTKLSSFYRIELGFKKRKQTVKVSEELHWKKKGQLRENKGIIPFYTC